MASSLGPMRIGSRATVKVARLEEYYVDLRLSDGGDVEQQVSEALHPDTRADEWDVIHTEVVDADPIYEDDPDAWRVWGDEEPSAPSTETYWDDSRHFEDIDRGENDA